jgi:hypothetical protein
VSARDFEPVWLPEDSRVRQGIVSATFLRHFNSCRRAAFLYETVKGPLSTAMDRGSALHAVQDRAIRAQIEQDERTVPPELVKAIVDEVLAEFDVPVEEHDYLRECAFRWASEWECDPERIIGPEQLIELDVGGMVVRCRVDRAMLSEDGLLLEVEDTKSSRSMPSMEEVARKRPDGSYMAKNMQLVLYALALVFGLPVRRSVDPVTGEVVEERDPFPVAPRAQLVKAAFVYPGIEERKGPRQGLMARREMTLTPVELHAYLASLSAMGERVAHAVETGDWRARPSSMCSECPAPLRCPIPPDLRTYADSGGVAAAGFVNSMEDAQRRAALIHRAKDVVAAWEKELKAWSKARDGVAIPFGADLEAGWEVVTSEVISDREEMFAAVERAALYGEDFDRGRYVKERTSTRWKVRVRDEGKGSE